MLTWLTFANLTFWAAFGAFALVSTNLFSLLLLAEGVWVGLYSLAGVVGSTVDEAGCFGLTFFILGLASVELCLGLLMLLALRRLKVSLNLQRNSKGPAGDAAQALSRGAWPKRRV
jgi:NADH:ubiquinone oxidoreductase subunit K